MMKVDKNIFKESGIKDSSIKTYLLNIKRIKKLLKKEGDDYSFLNNYDKVIFNIISDISKERIKDDIVTLANFGTRHTLSDTVSNERGIGAARRWIKKTFESISEDCNNCLEVFDQKNIDKLFCKNLVEKKLIKPMYLS